MKGFRGRTQNGGDSGTCGHGCLALRAYSLCVGRLEATLLTFLKINPFSVPRPISLVWVSKNGLRGKPRWSGPHFERFKLAPSLPTWLVAIPWTPGAECCAPSAGREGGTPVTRTKGTLVGLLMPFSSESPPTKQRPRCRLMSFCVHSQRLGG